MSSLARFAFNDNQVRIILIEGEPWFIGLDICKIMEIANSGEAFSRLKPYEKRNLDYSQVVTITDNPDITRLTAISESGLYRLIMTSRKPQAEPFQDWVCQEVLPSIRKIGKYESQPKLNIYARRVQIASEWNIPAGYWCVFHEVSLIANKVGEQYNVGDYDLLDGSVGGCWAHYRKDKEWAKPSTEFVGKLGDHRDYGAKPFKAYADSELQYFRFWLLNIYTLEKLPGYLKRKYGALVKA
jgi:prophage antirepressor-like protein